MEFQLTNFWSRVCAHWLVKSHSGWIWDKPTDRIDNYGRINDFPGCRIRGVQDWVSSVLLFRSLRLPQVFQLKNVLTECRRWLLGYRPIPRNGLGEPYRFMLWVVQPNRVHSNIGSTGYKFSRSLGYVFSNGWRDNEERYTYRLLRLLPLAAGAVMYDKRVIRLLNRNTETLAIIRLNTLGHLEPIQSRKRQVEQ